MEVLVDQHMLTAELLCLQIMIGEAILFCCLSRRKSGAGAEANINAAGCNFNSFIRRSIRFVGTDFFSPCTQWHLFSDVVSFLRNRMLLLYFSNFCMRTNHRLYIRMNDTITPLLAMECYAYVSSAIYEQQPAINIIRIRAARLGQKKKTIFVQLSAVIEDLSMLCINVSMYQCHLFPRWQHLYVRYCGLTCIYNGGGAVSSTYNTNRVRRQVMIMKMLPLVSKILFL